MYVCMYRITRTYFPGSGTTYSGLFLSVFVGLAGLTSTLKKEKQCAHYLLILSEPGTSITAAAVAALLTDALPTW